MTTSYNLFQVSEARETVLVARRQATSRVRRFEAERFRRRYTRQ